MTSLQRHHRAAVACIVALLTASALAPSRPSAAEDALARSRSVYAALRSYSDTGAMTTEYGPRGTVVTQHHTSKTLYRGPPQFSFEFTKAAWSDRQVPCSY